MAEAQGIDAMTTERIGPRRMRFHRAALATALALLAGCGGNLPVGPTGRIGASFRTDLYIDVAGAPLHLVHADRCIEYTAGSSTVWAPPAGGTTMLPEMGGFTAEQGGWRLIVPAPMMCDLFSSGRRDDVPPPDQQSKAPEKSLSPDYLPLIAAEPIDGSGPLRLYLSRDTLTRPGEPIQLRRMTATIPVNTPIPDNTRPVPLRRMLLGQVPGRCFRAWLLSPADPAFWRGLTAPTAFAAQATQPSPPPAAVVRALDPWGATPVTLAQWQKIDDQSRAISSAPRTAFDLRAELYLMQGAQSLAPRRLVDTGLLWDNEEIRGRTEWVFPQVNLAASVAGWGVLSAAWPLGGNYAPFLQIAPEHLIPLTQTENAHYRPAEGKPGMVVEYSPDPDSACPLPTGPITLALGPDSLRLAPFAVFYWPEKGTFYRLIPSALRLP
jgi:hypothetical protein